MLTSIQELKFNVYVPKKQKNKLKVRRMTKLKKIYHNVG